MRYGVDQIIPPEELCEPQARVKILEMRRNELAKRFIDIVMDGKVHCFRYREEFMEDIMSGGYRARLEIEHIDLIEMLEEKEERLVKGFDWKDNANADFRAGELSIIKEL